MPLYFCLRFRYNGCIELIEEFVMSELFGYAVEIKQYCIHSHREPEEYGSWEEEYENSLVGISPTKEYPDIVSNIEVKTGETCFVVWAVWSNGDSFGTAYNGSVEPLALFKTYDEARGFRLELEKACNNSDEYGFLLKFDYLGFEYSVYALWKGYFESLSGYEIDEIVMG